MILEGHISFWATKMALAANMLHMMVSYNQPKPAIKKQKEKYDRAVVKYLAYTAMKYQN